MSDIDQIRRRILFDPRQAETRSLGASSRLKPIPWPAGLAPIPVHSNPAPVDTDPLPPCDVLIVTYTAAEGHALADVLTPGFDTTTWTKYRNGWAAIKALIEGHKAPSLESDCAGLWAQTRIGGQRVVVMKSDLHPATDGPNLPIRTAWRQWISQTGAKLVITTGTAGGVGADVELGDVIVGTHVRWNCQKQFKAEPWATASYATSDSLGSFFQAAQDDLLPVNATQIPAQYRTRPLEIIEGHDIETTDFFAFDTSDDHYGLRAYDGAAAAVEMDDAALGLALSGMANPPAWAAVRNASDPGNLGGTLEQADKLAEKIYEDFGYFTTIGSAITCWALVAGMA